PGPHQDRPRSAGAGADRRPHGARPLAGQLLRRDRTGGVLPRQPGPRHRLLQRPAAARSHLFRSEEHTSELQSRENLVCRLLLASRSPRPLSPLPSTTLFRSHLDPTKIVPEALVPVRIVGRMVLDRWPDNFFAETEQVAFCPANLVPGIDFSNDPLLHGRIFSYLDTQLIRLGGPNFHQIPVNQPRCPFANHQRDGHMQMQIPKGRVNYEPSSLQEDSPRADARAGFRSHASRADDGAKGRLRPESFADHYSQARMFFRSLEAPEQAHLASALVFELSKVETPKVRERMVGQLRNIDASLAQRVADGLGLDALPEAPPAAVPARDMPPAPEVRTIGRMKQKLEGRCVGILFDEGSDAAALDALVEACLAEGASVKLVAPRLGGATLSDGRR